ncbi:helicase-related protein [Polaribacter sargassicola]|uniref:helicase-related protein n=1 Tax=Polaribacter sargassicola TaxID=2836891 RepID=UPI001F3AE013|nr:helicase-related protein [Polaribacter sp. DS7-9]MCG1037713.1 helicase C-terminal domain-containing protein [Polaribacter sp. DS7-9]
MNKFIEKRDSLESYVKEQVIGPGAYNKKYFFLKDWKKSIYSDKDLSEIPALENFDEVIPEVPAYQYSSAILFPLTTQSNEGKNIKQEENEEEEQNEETSVNTSADDDDIIEDTSSNVVLTQQNYPTTFGISFVFDNNKNINQDLKVSLSYRKYQRISKKNLLQNKIAIQVKEYKTEIKEIVEKYLNSLFSIENKNSNIFILPRKIFDQTEIYNIDYNLINHYVDKEFIPILNNTFNNELVELNNTNQVRYFGLGNNQFYSISASKYNHTNVYTIFTDSISDFIQKELEKGIFNYSKYKALIKELEIYNQLIQITTDLKSILKKKDTVPIWKSKKFIKEISLPIVKRDLIQRENRKSVDEQDTESLQYYVQYYIPNPDDNKVYVKLLIENINEYKLKLNEPPQLNKKNKANELSFFGVELTIHETIENSLLQYNPPQLLDFDEEDSFNKLIYRNYIDYGEGYNTSVNWGKTKDNLNFISSEFLPTQETPSVDFKPSKVVDGEIKDRLEDDNILSMRYLSTLSNSIKTDVIDGLNSFIDSYGNENNISWIKDKQEALDNESLDDKSKGLLNKQLEACRNDYKRLKRNISLLENNDEALAAFRTMNTAMFMQLHHSIKSKGKIPFVPNNEDVEAFYSEEIVTDKEGNVTEYKWRSFQLAFILLNVDAFVKPKEGDNTVKDLFDSGWPERNEIADLVWFPTGGGKTEAYLGIIAFAISLRRFTKGELGYGTTVLMRYTLRMLTLQQFQRATLLICALEVIRKDNFTLPNKLSLGDERITIGLFVGGDSLPNYWNQGDKSMIGELQKISDSITNNQPISTSLPFTDCPWCGGDLFKDAALNNVLPNHRREIDGGGKYKPTSIESQLNISCNTDGCTFHSRRSSNTKSLPLRLFDEDIYKYPPTLLFGTVDKFAAFANNVSTVASGRNKDSQRLIGKGYDGRNRQRNVLPPELIIQDELHLLLGPLGSSVGLFEKSIDYLCTYPDEDGNKIKPKIVTSTATTRNTDKQIFALFNRRSEIFPKQGITCDDSFFAFYKRKKTAIETYESKRKYVGVLPIGKTQVWMQLRIISITLSHRLKYFKEKYTIDQVFENPTILDELKKVFDYFHTVLAYYNSLKDVGKAQSQLDHYLPGDISFIIKNTIPWSFLDSIIRSDGEINYSELTGRLSGEEVKTNLAEIEKKWSLLDKIDNGNKFKLNKISNPEFIIATNMISVGIDVSRFNTIVINSMPRNIAEYIQASSRVARDEDGIVFTVHHPFRSRDISHYQKFKEFHEKFYSYVEPISVTPFASKALDRYLAMYAIVIIRHNEILGLMNNDSAREIDNDKIETIKGLINVEIQEVYNNSLKLDEHLKTREAGVTSTIDGIISQEEVDDINFKLNELLNNWIGLIDGQEPPVELNYRIHNERLRSLFTSASDGNRWKVSHSLREIGASAVIKTVQQ